MTDVPQQEIEGMHFVAKIQFSADKNGVAAAVVKQSHIDSWGIDKGQFFHDACGSSVPDVYGVKGWVSNYIK